jgi:hypothetical protein
VEDPLTPLHWNYPVPTGTVVELMREILRDGRPRAQDS